MLNEEIVFFFPVGMVLLVSGRRSGIRGGGRFAGPAAVVAVFRSGG